MNLHSHCVDSLAQALAILRVAETQYGQISQTARESGGDPNVHEELWQALVDVDNYLSGNERQAASLDIPAKWLTPLRQVSKWNNVPTSTAARSAVQRRGYIRRNLVSKRSELSGKGPRGLRFELTPLGEQWIREICAVHALRHLFDPPDTYPLVPRRMPPTA